MKEFFALTYVHHDCFMLRTAHVQVVFDYWQDPRGLSADGLPLFLAEADPSIPLFVLVSHFHKDHYNKDIFSWGTRFPQIHYIISRDVARHARYLLKPDSTYAGAKVSPQQVTILSKGESFSSPLLTVHAFGSTDIGNSYVCEIPPQTPSSPRIPDSQFPVSDFPLTLLHAGDLNCWTWRDESTPAEIQAAEHAFHSELAPIAGKFPALDIALFPVDSRIGTGYEEGARTLLSKIAVKHFLPMHFTLPNAPGESTETLKAELRQRLADAAAFSLYATPGTICALLSAPGDTLYCQSPIS